MAITYKTRRKCNAEDTNSNPGDKGHNKGWHYIFEDQTTIDEEKVCPGHPTATIEHFVITATEGEA